MAAAVIRLCIVATANNIHAQRWVRAFASRPDYHVTLLSPYGPPRTPADLCGAELVFREPPSKSLSAWQRAQTVRRNYAWTRSFLLEKHFDLVHLHQLPHPSTVTYFRGLPRMIVTPWGTDILRLGNPYRRLLWQLGRRYILRQAAAITASSAYLARETSRYAPHGRRIAVIPFGVDTRLFSPLPELRQPAPPVRLVSTKHLLPVYGMQVLLQALGIVSQASPDFEAVIAGDGPQRGELQALAGSLGIADRVTFTGHVGHDLLPPLLNRGHIYVMPSLQESFGVAAAEAMACELPAIGSRTGGIPEIIQDGLTGSTHPAGRCAGAGSGDPANDGG